MSYNYEPAKKFGQPVLLDIWPETRDKSLVPCDSADEYLLDLIAEEYDDISSLNIAVVNDSHGALTLSLLQSVKICVSDSFLAQRSITQNLEKNNLSTDIVFGTSLGDLPKGIDLVVMKIPKSLASFRFTLGKIRKHIGADVTILAGGMAKYMPPNFYEIFEESSSEPSYSLIKKRARYYRGKLKAWTPESEEPAKEYSWEDLKIKTLPGVFSFGRIDRGTQFLLEHFPRFDNPEVVVDPGCGSGILGIKAAKSWPDAKVISIDESALAVESTKISAELNGVKLDARTGHIMEDLEDESVDLIVCNPPFHQDQRMHLEAGFAFIYECARVLKPGGQLFMVTNKTLGHEKLLGELFEGALVLSQNKKYRIHMCRKRKS